MNRRHPVGTVGGGGWQPNTFPRDSGISKAKKEQVLSEMFEMFLDALDSEIIESVVHSYHYDSSKAMEALISITSSNDSSADNHPKSLNHNQAAQVNNVSGLDAISVAYGNDDDDVIVENESEVEICGNNTSVSTYVSPHPSVNPISNHSLLEVKENPQVSKNLVDQPHFGNFDVQQNSYMKPSCFFPKNGSVYNFQQSWNNIQMHIENGKRILILMRGCPGSGKSTLAMEIIKSIGGNPHEHIFSTDNFFNFRGKYTFRPALLEQAHKWNQESALAAVKSGISPIIIDNTHTQMWEMDAYVYIALTHGYAIEILEPQTRWFLRARELYRRNSHGIPLDKIELMLNRYEFNITACSLIERAVQRGLIFDPNLPLPASKPLGMRKRGTNSPKNTEVPLSQPSDIHTLRKTGAIKKGQSVVTSPCKSNSNISSSTDKIQHQSMPSTNTSVEDLIQFCDESSKADISRGNSSSNSGFCSEVTIESPVDVSERSTVTDVCKQTFVENLDKSECLLSSPKQGIENLASTSADFEVMFGKENCLPKIVSVDVTMSTSKKHAGVEFNKSSNLKEPLSKSDNQTAFDFVSDSQNLGIYVSSEDEEIPDNESFSTEFHIPLKNNQSSIMHSVSDFEDLTNPLMNLAVSSTSNVVIGQDCNTQNASLDLSVLHQANNSTSADEVKEESLSLECADSLNIEVEEESMKEEVSCGSQNDKAVKDSTLHCGNTNKDDIIAAPTEKFEKLSVQSDITNISLPLVPTISTSSPGSDLCEISSHSSTLCETGDLLTPGCSKLSVSCDGSNVTGVSQKQESFINKDAPSQLSENLDPWTLSESWHKEEISDSQQNTGTSTQPQPPRTPKAKRYLSSPFISKSEPAHPSSSEGISWTFSDSDNVSWQTIDKNQEEFYGKNCSNLEDFPHSQRAKFGFIHEKKHDCSDKETMTHHSDFLLLNSPASSVLESGARVLKPIDRDINFGQTYFERKTCLKLMLDKSTSTESEYLLSDEGGSHEKLKELSRLFPNVPKAGLVELLEKCQGDVNWVSNLLLDTDNDVFSSTFFQESNEETSLDVIEDINLGIISDSQCSSRESISTENKSTLKDIQSQSKEAKEIKRHLENSIVISDEKYSPHVRSIRNFRKALRDGSVPNQDQHAPSTSHGHLVESSDEHEDTEVKQDIPHEGNRAKSEEGSDEDDDDGDLLELVVGQDLIQQLLDKFGGADVWSSKRLSPVVKMPVSIARHLHYYLLTSQENNEEVEDAAVRMQYEEDERIARQLYEDMRETKQNSEPSPPQLQEIMDFQMAEAIFQADLNALNRTSTETMATVLAKRLLQDNFPNIDSKILHDMLQAHGNSFEETMKVLRQSLANDDAVFSVKGRAQRETNLLDKAKKASLSDALADASAHRDTAELLKEQRRECYLKARDAFQRKERSVAAYYAQLANCYKKNIDQAHARAAASLVAANVKSRAPDTLDLHYLRVAEALQVLDLFLDRHISTLSDSATGKANLFIITGRGARSVDGKSKIRPAVIRRIKERNLEFTIENPGLLKLSVSRHSPLSCRTIP